MKTNIFKENLYKLPSFKKVGENTTFLNVHNLYKIFVDILPFSNINYLLKFPLFILASS